MNRARTFWRSTIGKRIVIAVTGLGVCVIDVFSVQPVDRDALIAAARGCGGIVITVEDHYAHGGIGDVVLAALAEERCVVHKLAVREIPHSGKPKELLDRYGISATHIVAAVKAALASVRRAPTRGIQVTTPYRLNPAIERTAAHANRNTKSRATRLATS
jgi:Transketolase, C-terminal domain